jgi:hypothetical protein
LKHKASLGSAISLPSVYEAHLHDTFWRHAEAGDHLDSLGVEPLAYLLLSGSVEQLLRLGVQLANRDFHALASSL